MASFVPCVKNAAGGYTFYVSLVSQADVKIFQANPTLAAGDVKIAIDDGAPANLGTLPAVDADFTKRVKVVLSQAETNGDNLTIIFSDAAGAEWCDRAINIQTTAQTFDTIDANIDTLLVRLTALRAGYLDNLSGGAVALAASWTAALATALGNYTAARAAYLDELAAANIPADIDTLLTRIMEALTLATIADAIWDELIAGHTGAGSAGKKLGDIPTRVTKI